jgi:UDP-glucose 4-epimerase
VLDEDLVRAEMARVEGVFHLAAHVGVRRVLARASATLEEDVRGTRHVVAAAAEHGARVLFASSSEVYGQSEATPFAEDGPLLVGKTREPRWSYACAKALGESLCFAHAREHGLAATVVRFFNVVGPRQSPEHGMVLPRFVRAALAGEPIEVYGDGAQTRCFVHVADALAAVLALWDEPRARGQVVNVGSTDEVTIGALAQEVRRASGGRASIVHLPYREAYGTAVQDFRRRVPDLARLTELIGRCAPRPLATIVAELVAAERLHAREHAGASA